MAFLSAQTLALTNNLTKLTDSSTALCTAAFLLAAFVLSRNVFRKERQSTDIYELGGWSILTASSFFDRRFDFLTSNFAKSGEKLFSFKIFQHTVVATSGADARKIFFDSKTLNITEGYKILHGAVPRVSELKVCEDEDESQDRRRVVALLHRDRVEAFLPVLLDDIRKRMEGWGREGAIDPFKNFDDLAWQMTARMMTCSELADNFDVISQLQQHFAVVAKNATPTALLLPWLPLPSKKHKRDAVKGLCKTLEEYVEMRKASPPSPDAIDYLLAQGLTTEKTIDCVLMAIFGGVSSPPISLSWIILFLALHREWKDKVLAEVRSIIERYTDMASIEPLHKRLATIPVSVWEDDMPMFDLVTAETLRLTVNGSSVRRIIAGDLHVNDKTIRNGSFATYSFSDVHLNSNIYPNPKKFDPTRFLPGREEDKKEAYGFLAWGAGRHPCIGARFAKLEMKIIICYFLTAYEYGLIDARGNTLDRLPDPNFNDVHQTRPLGDPCCVRFKRILD